MFEKITIEAVNKDGYILHFELPPKTGPKDALEWLKSSGYKPTGGHSAESKPQQIPTNGQNDLTFTAKTLTATVNDGKAYWKVKGGRFSKYGVSIWPEVLKAAGFDPDSLNVMDTYDVSGYTAYYMLNEEEKPQKVTRLAK